MNRALTATLCACLAWPLLSCAGPQAVRHELSGKGLPVAGMPFTQARKQLMQAHWLPVRLPPEEGREYESLEQELLNHGVVEVEMCSIDTSSCIFHYQRAGQCLRVDTVGEHLPLMRVVALSAVCPDDAVAADGAW